MASYAAIAKAEGSRSDAIAVLQLVLRAAPACGGVEKPTAVYLDLLRQHGGSDETAKTIAVFRQIFGI